MIFHFRKTLPLFLVLLLLAAVVSCGSGNGRDQGVTPVRGSVAILLTDSPAGDFSEINITITRVELLSEDFKVTVSSETQTINLLALKDETSLIALSTGVPIGPYDKIRLHISGIELVDSEGNPVNEHVKLPGNGKIDLNPRGWFLVEQGGTLTLQLDIDAEKSIHIVETGNKKKYVFRPVVFIKVIGGDIVPDKFVRISGTVLSIDSGNMMFVLCPAHAAGAANTASTDDDNDDNNVEYPACISVFVSEETSFFYSGDEGNQVPFSALEVGASVTVIGKLRVDYAEQAYSKPDDGYGNGDDDDDYNHTVLGVDAIVVEIGEFLTLSGEIITPPDETGRFDFMPDPGQEISSGALIHIQLQPGTGIFNSTGAPLDRSSLTPSTHARIDGVFMASNTAEDVLNAAFVLVDVPAAALEELGGAISGIDYPGRTFLLIPSDTGMDPVCVEVPGDAHILLVHDDAGYMIQTVMFEDLLDGQGVTLFGTFGADCFVPRIVVAETEDTV